jgi:hypothetical protein
MNTELDAKLMKNSIDIATEVVSQSVERVSELNQLSSDFEVCVRIGGIRVCVSVDF